MRTTMSGMAWAALGALLCTGSLAHADTAPPPCPGMPRLSSAQLEHLRAAERWIWSGERRPQAPPPLATAQPNAAGGTLELTSSVGTLDFAPSAGTFSSDTVLTIKATGNVGNIYLYLRELSAGSTAVADAQGPLQTYDQGYGILAVALRQVLLPGDSVTLTVTQSGTPKCSSSFLGLVTCMITPSMIFSLGAWRPLVYDIGAGKLLSAHSASVAVTAPQGLSVGSTGRLQGVTQNPDGTQTFTYDGVPDDNYSFGAAPYDVGELSFGDKTARSHLLGLGASHGKEWRQAMADVIAFHAARYGPYTPSSIAMVEVPDAAGAAFGPFTAIFCPTSSVSFAPTDWSLTTTLAHELAHQWFGGIIDLQDNTSPWINEGFATFAEMEYTSSLASKELGQDFRPTYRKRQRERYLYRVRALGGQEVPISSQGIYNAPSQLYVVLTYSKGALVVGMLRYLLGGDDAFFAALRAYREDHAQQGATALSFKTSLEKASGLDLTPFFKSWVYGTGYPTYKVRVQRGAAGQPSRITVNADRDTGLPVELDLVDAQGQVSRVRLPRSAAQPTRFEHLTQGEVVAVRFDPDQQLAGRSLGALPGDLQLNGAVDGVDLVLAAMEQGQTYDTSTTWSQQDFASHADLVFDGTIDQQDLDIVLGSFGKQTGDQP